ncbi:MAG: thioredoxin family protein [Thaumarchaeota archaeon]|nr:thioredoxin family protein [Nitrososphaerota archaeon]
MPHHIEIFAGNCSLCKKVVDIITIGKCATCKMDVIDVDATSLETNRKIVSYDITSVPTIVIDGRIKVVEVPNFPWFCGEEFYKILEEKHPLLQAIE